MIFMTSVRQLVPGNLADRPEIYGIAGVAPQRRFEAAAARIAEDVDG
jgi:hypothetical protein